MQNATPNHEDLLKLVGVGNIAAKFETKKMIRESKVTDYVHVAFS